MTRWSRHIFMPRLKSFCVPGVKLLVSCVSRLFNCQKSSAVRIKLSLLLQWVRMWTDIWCYVSEVQYLGGTIRFLQIYVVGRRISFRVVRPHARRFLSGTEVEKLTIQNRQTCRGKVCLSSYFHNTRKMNVRFRNHWTNLHKIMHLCSTPTCSRANLI